MTQSTTRRHTDEKFCDASSREKKDKIQINIDITTRCLSLSQKRRENKGRSARKQRSITAARFWRASTAARRGDQGIIGALTRACLNTGDRARCPSSIHPRRRGGGLCGSGSGKPGAGAGQAAVGARARPQALARGCRPALARHHQRRCCLAAPTRCTPLSPDRRR
jgi:hypothetical protein